MPHTPAPWHDDGFRIYAPTEDSNKRNGRVIVEYKHLDCFNNPDSKLIAQAPAMYELLKGMEFVFTDDDGCGLHSCLVCGGNPVSGHVENCRLAAVLKAVEGDG